MLFVSPSGGVCDTAGPPRSPFWSSRCDQPRRLWAAPAGGSPLRVSPSSEAVVGKESRGSHLCLAAPAFPGSVHPKSSKLPSKPPAGPIPLRHCFSLVILIKNSAWHPSSYRRKPQSLWLSWSFTIQGQPASSWASTAVLQFPVGLGSGVGALLAQQMRVSDME